MALTTTHAFVSGVADGSDPTQVQPSNWNAAHVLSGELPVANGGTGGATAADARSNLGAAASGGITSSGLTQATAKMLGRSTAGTGAVEEIAVGSGLSLSGGTLSATGGGSGTVTSVDVSGGTTGLTTSGGPVTTSGTITMAGTLAVANGGTGATTASGARTALGLAIGTDVLAPNGSAASLTSFPTLNQNTTGTASNVTGTVAIANGGTGQTTAQAAINALAGAQTSGQFLRGNGTNVVMAAIQAADVPTLNQNTTGTASNVTGTVAVANGGTGGATAADARTNLGAAASGAVTSSGLTQSTAKMLGRSTAGTGAVEEIAVGSGLSLSGGTLSATGGGGSTPPPVRLTIGDGTVAIVASAVPVAYASIPAGCTIAKWRALADVSGSISIDVWKDGYANFPPTAADKISASAPISLSSATKNEDSTLTGWTTTVTAGDVLAFYVSSASTVKQVFITVEFS